MTETVQTETIEAQTAALIAGGGINMETFKFETPSGTPMDVPTLVGFMINGLDAQLDLKRAKGNIDIALLEMVRRAVFLADGSDFGVGAHFEALVQLAEAKAEESWRHRHSNQENPPKWKKPATWRTIVSRYRLAIRQEIYPDSIHEGYYKAPVKVMVKDPDSGAERWNGKWTLPAPETVTFDSVANFNKIWKIHPDNENRKDHVEELNTLNENNGTEREDVAEDGEGALPEWVQNLTPQASVAVQSIAVRYQEFLTAGDAEGAAKLLEGTRNLLKRHKAPDTKAA